MQFVLGIALLALHGASVTLTAQTTTVTFLVFPGAEETAVEIQARLAAHNVEVQLFCSVYSEHPITLLGSKCELVVPSERLWAIAQEVDFLLIGAFTSDCLRILQELLRSLVQKGGGAVGVGTLYKIHVVTIPGTGIRSLHDLDDESHAQRTSTGPEQSVHDVHAHDVFRAEKLYNVLNLHQHNELPSQPDLLLSRVLDAFFETTKVPSPHVAKVADRNELILIAIPQDTVDRMNALKDDGEAPYIPTEIDFSTYEEGASGSVETAGVTEVIAATPRPSAELVELVTQLLIEEPLMSLEDLSRTLRWLKGQRIPIHPVAASIIDDFLGRHQP